MDSLDRRQILLGAGLTLAVAGCTSGRGRKPQRLFDEQWNLGDDPRKPFPGNDGFNPSHTVLLHMHLQPDMLLDVTQFEIPAVSGPDYWSSNGTSVVGAIKALNSMTTKPTNNPSIKYGFEKFEFREPRHVVIYIKNVGIEIDKEYPLWFGTKAQGTLYGLRKAEKNKSFYGVHRLENIGIGDGNSELAIYAENHFTMTNWLGGHHKIGWRQYQIYSMNINAATMTTPPPQGMGSAVKVPIIIDPDTGNMGGGSPIIGT